MATGPQLITSTCHTENNGKYTWKKHCRLDVGGWEKNLIASIAEDSTAKAASKQAPEISVNSPKPEWEAAVQQDCLGFNFATE